MAILIGATMRASVRTSLVLLVLFIGNVEAAWADYIRATLATAGPNNYSVLTLNGATDIALNGPGTTIGNVGISTGGNLQLNSSNGNPSVAVQGNVYLGNTATINNPAQLTGTVFTNQNAKLNQANTDARNASTTFAALAPTLKVPGGAINGNTTINGMAGVNVVNVSGINLGNGQKLTLNGPAGSQFIINDSGGMQLNSGQVVLRGGLTANDMVLNFTSSGQQLQTSGGLHNESVINGILLAPRDSIGFAPGLINGELIAGGQSVHLVSGASVNSPPRPPRPSPRRWCWRCWAASE
jgi:hypothetical protein